MTDNIIKGLVSPKIPIIENRSKHKQDELDQIRTKIMQNEEARNKIKDLANSLNENFNSSTQMIVDMRVGARFKDSLTNKIYSYEYFVVPFEHDARTIVILEEAHRPVDEFGMDHIMIFYDVESNPSPRYAISTLDFCKYIACKVWTIVDLNVNEEKEFLNKIDK